MHALNAVTLAIELEGPVGYFLNLLTYNITYPVPRHIVETYGEDWTAVGKIVTNGPFRLESWQRGESGMSLSGGRYLESRRLGYPDISLV